MQCDLGHEPTASPAAILRILIADDLAVPLFWGRNEFLRRNLLPRAINRSIAHQALRVIGVHQLPRRPIRRLCLRAFTGIGPRDRHRRFWLAGEPQRVPDGLEHGPVMACAQGLIPLKDGWRFHDQTLFRVEHWRSFPQFAVRNVKGQLEGQRRRLVSD